MKSQPLDQLAHIGIGFLICLLAHHGQYALASFAVGLVREHGQMQQKSRDLGVPWDWGWGRTTDVFFWAVGGGLVQWLTRWF